MINENCGPTPRIAPQLLTTRVAQDATSSNANANHYQFSFRTASQVAQNSRTSYPHIIHQMISGHCSVGQGSGPPAGLGVEQFRVLQVSNSPVVIDAHIHVHLCGGCTKWSAVSELWTL